jgi:membrane associated rhomboid family serine protease
MALLSRYNPPDFSEDQVKADKQFGRYALFVALCLIVMIWLIKLFEVEYNLDFSKYGIVPLEAKGLRGILMAPLIHSNFEHLMANTIPLFVLTFSLFFFYRRAFLIFIFIYLLSGLCVWIFGREAFHIGASGIIYGLAAFLFLSGILSKNIRLLTISLIVAFLYGYLFWGIFPLKPDISWESHLWGGVIGFGAALVWGRTPKMEVVEEKEDEEEIPTDEE